MLTKARLLRRNIWPCQFNQAIVDIHLSNVYQEEAVQVSKWGNSLAVRLPAAVVEALDLKEGDNIEIMIAGSRAFEVSKTPDATDILARLRQFRGRLPAGFKFNRLEANER
jgi:antitoxin MazE